MNVNKLKGLMAECGHNQKDVSEYLGISTYGFRLKMNGTHEFKASEIKKLADFYNVSVDYFFSPNIAKIATKNKNIAVFSSESEVVRRGG